jgi:hypothetical protein
MYFRQKDNFYTDVMHKLKNDNLNQGKVKLDTNIGFPDPTFFQYHAKILIAQYPNKESAIKSWVDSMITDTKKEGIFSISKKDKIDFDDLFNKYDNYIRSLI